MHPEQRQERQGVLSIEALLLIPLLLCILLAIIEFGLLISTQILLKSAAKQAADYAAMGMTRAEILGRVADVLGPTRYAIVSAPGTGTLAVDAIVPNPMDPLNPIVYPIFPVVDDPMDPNDGPDNPLPLNTGDTFQICITVNAIQLVPNLLAWCGFSLGDTKLTQCCSTTYVGP